MSALAPEDRAARRFTRAFLAVLLGGLSVLAAVALVVDPTSTFGTGQIPSILTGEYASKPPAFLTIVPPPQAVVLGSSRVLKLRPACIEEITGLPAFNFGMNAAMIDDMAAIWRFIRARSRVPIRELIIGIDAETFDSRFKRIPRARWALEARDYLGSGADLSFDSAARALFAWTAFHSGRLSLRHYLKEPDAAPEVSFARDGFVTYNVMEARMRAGTFKPDKKDDEVTGSNVLSPERVALFREMIAAAHADGINIDVFISPPQVANLDRRATRSRDLDVLLGDLERAGMIRYFRITRIEDVGGDPQGYFNGLHMTETNASRVLLAMFHHSHGCGL